MSGGRAVIGLGASGPQVIEGFHGVPYDKPLGRTREVIEILRMGLRREPLVHEGIFTLPLPADQGLGLGKPLKLLTRPERSSVPLWVAALGDKNVAMTAEVADGWLPHLFYPEKAHTVWGEALARGAAKRSADLGPLEISAGGMVAIGEGPDTKALLDFVRPMYALYVGGMGARGKNFYNDLACQYGYEKEAKEIQDLYLDGKKKEAEALVPVEWLEAGNLVGPASYVKERLAAFAEAGVTTLSVVPATEPGRHHRADQGVGVLMTQQSRPSIYEQEHEDFRTSVRTFMEKEVVPHHDQWEKDGQVSREVWLKAGEAGLLCFDVDEEYGGAGVKDFRYNTIVAEELARVGASGPGFPVHSDIIVPYISQLGTDEQKQRWLPGLVSGEIISAIAMTEPGAGSDLQGIRTSAVDKGDHYVLNGSKTFISNGILSDLVIVVCRTDPDAGHKGISLLVVERGMTGFERGRNLDKVGMKAQDTAELFFDNVEVPKANLLGEEGSGFISLMMNLPQERISIAAMAVAAIEQVLEMSLSYAKERQAFGKPIGSFQHNRFVLAEMATNAHVARVFINDCILKLNAGEVDPTLASMAKWWTTELQKQVVDAGVQLHGGYGYMMEYPIAKAFTDSRIQTIYGGTTEIQKEIIGRSLGI